MLNYKKYIGKVLDVSIDRPLGSKHPSFDSIYEVNYGYIPNTVAEDGKEIDAYILGESEPLTIYKGVCIAIIKRLDDVENKLVIAPEGKSYSDEEIIAATNFTEQYFKIEIQR